MLNDPQHEHDALGQRWSLLTTLHDNQRSLMPTNFRANDRHSQRPSTILDANDARRNISDGQRCSTILNDV